MSEIPSSFTFRENRISKIAKPFSELMRCEPDNPVSIVSREVLSGSEPIVGAVATAADVGFVSTATVLKFGQMASLFPSLWEPTTHTTSVLATNGIIGASVLTSEAIAGMFNASGHETLAKVARIAIPVAGAVATAGYHWAAESGAFPGLGRADLLGDGLYGIISIAPSFMLFRFLSAKAQFPQLVGRGAVMLGDFSRKHLSPKTLVKPFELRFKKIIKLK